MESVMRFVDIFNRLIDLYIEEKNMNSKRALVCGAGGFIGSHLVKRLKKEGFWVRGVDLKHPEFSESEANEFIIADLRNPYVYAQVYDGAYPFDEVYQLAADMGGAGFVFTGENDADIMHNDAMINLNTVDACVQYEVKKVFYSSSACAYPEYNQIDPDNPKCSEDSAYPAAPDSEYGWEKLFSERMYMAYNKNKNLNVRIARFHNILAQKVHGKEVEKKLLLPCVERLQNLLQETVLKYGEMEIKQGLFFI